MNSLRMVLNYLDLSNYLVILTSTLIIIVTYLLLFSDISFFSFESSHKTQKIKSSKNLNKKEDSTKVEEDSNKNKKVEIKGFHQNEFKENNKKFKLSDLKDNLDHLSQKINNINDKNDIMGLMFIEGLSSLNSWKNDIEEKEIFKKLEWNLEKRENDEESLIYQYVFPHLKENNNSTNNNILASSHESINSLTETEDGEEEKERQILSSYKLGICKIFEKEKEKNIKTNIVKELKDNFYKIYSQGDPEIIKNKCKRDTIPENYDEIILKNKNEGNEVMSICGKKIKMNYLQCQRMERSKCESNMTFLGLVFYKSYKEGHNPGYS